MSRAERYARALVRFLCSDFAAFIFTVALAITIFQFTVKAITGEWIPLPR